MLLYDYLKPMEFIIMVVMQHDFMEFISLYLRIGNSMNLLIINYHDSYLTLILIIS